MAEQSTALGLQDDFSRVRRRLGILLPLCAAAVGVMATFVAGPLSYHLLTATENKLGGLDAAVAALAVTPFLPGAAVLVLGMRASLSKLLRDGTAGSAKKRIVFHGMIGIILLHTLFLALFLMRPLNRSALLRSVLLGVAALTAAFVVNYVIILIAPPVGRAAGAISYFFILNTVAALAICLAVAVPAWRALGKLRNGRTARTVSIAGASGLAGAAVAGVFFALFIALLREALDDAFLENTLLFILLPAFLLQAVALLLIPLNLLRASADYSRLRHADSAPRQEAGRMAVTGSAAGEFIRVRRRLAILLPLYAAAAAAAVTAAFVAFPLGSYLISPVRPLDWYLLINFVLPAFTLTALIPGVAALALGMRASLKDLLSGAAADTAQERIVLHALTGIILLHTLFLALFLMRPLNRSSLVRSVLLGVAVVAVAALLNLLVIVAVAPAYTYSNLVYFILLAIVALAICAATATLMRRAKAKLRDGETSRVVSTAMAWGLAAAAATALAAVLASLLLRTLLSADDRFFFDHLLLPISIVLFILQGLALLLLPALLRASASHGQLRQADRPAPVAPEDEGQ